MMQIFRDIITLQSSSHFFQKVLSIIRPPGQLDIPDLFPIHLRPQIQIQFIYKKTGISPIELRNKFLNISGVLLHTSPIRGDIIKKSIRSVKLATLNIPYMKSQHGQRKFPKQESNSISRC